MRLRLGVLAGTVIGLALALALIGVVGVGRTLGAAGQIGFAGFALFCLVSLGLLAVLGLAWQVAAPGAAPGKAPVFLWGRLVREAASELLPFSQMGGLVVGAQAVIALGVPEALTFAATIVDLTTEMVAQLIFMLAGLGGLTQRLSGRGHNGGLLLAAAAVVAAGTGVIVGFAILQRRSVSAVGWLAQRWLPGGVSRAEAVTSQLDAIYRQRGRMAAAVALHGAGWLGGAWVSWFALRLMGASIPYWSVLVIESLMSAVRSFGFVIPGGLGLQEGAYLILGPLFGLPPERALALSLLKRARDLALGLPALLAWQVLEGRALMSRKLSDIT